MPDLHVCLLVQQAPQNTVLQQQGALAHVTYNVISLFETWYQLHRLGNIVGQADQEGHLRETNWELFSAGSWGIKWIGFLCKISTDHTMDKDSNQTVIHETLNKVRINFENRLHKAIQDSSGNIEQEWH